MANFFYHFPKLNCFLALPGGGEDFFPLLCRGNCLSLSHVFLDSSDLVEALLMGRVS